MVVVCITQSDHENENKWERERERGRENFLPLLDAKEGVRHQLHVLRQEGAGDLLVVAISTTSPGHLPLKALQQRLELHQRLLVALGRDGLHGRHSGAANCPQHFLKLSPVGGEQFVGGDGEEGVEHEGGHDRLRRLVQHSRQPVPGVLQVARVGAISTAPAATAIGLGDVALEDGGVELHQRVHPLLEGLVRLADGAALCVQLVAAADHELLRRLALLLNGVVGQGVGADAVEVGEEDPPKDGVHAGPEDAHHGRQAEGHVLLLDGDVLEGVEIRR